MSLQRLIQRARLLLDRGMYESRRAFRPDPESADETLRASALEERILMSAAPVAVVAEAVSQESAPLNDAEFLDVLAGQVIATDSEAESGRNSSLESQQATELVFVDSAVDDLDEVLADLQGTADGALREVVLLDSQSDGIAQITQALIGRQNIESIHLVSHGDPGQLTLGSTTLSAQNIGQYESALSAWQNVLADDADILIYGCNLASTTDGQELLSVLAAQCGCDVAASDDNTGHAALGADWDLEFTDLAPLTGSSF